MDCRRWAPFHLPKTDAFISSAAKNGVSRNIAEKVFEQLAAFAAYGFCKAHAAAYAELAYQTLWLKCHYPAEFFAALLSNQPMGYYPPRVLVADARRHGVKILPLDVNCSCDNYTVEGEAIRIGFRQLKGISEDAIASILSERAGGKFTTLRDFALRAVTSRPIVENLIKVGAFDDFGHREELLAQVPKVIDLKQRTSKISKQLFDDVGQEPALTYTELNGGWESRILVERDLLSLDLSAHPLDFLSLDDDITKMGELALVRTGKAVNIVGSVIRYQTPPTRDGNRVVYIIMEDGTGVADVTVFGDVQEKCGHVLFREGWLKVRGKVQRRGPKALSIIAEELFPLTVC